MASFKSSGSMIGLGHADFDKCSLEAAQFLSKKRFQMLTVSVPSERKHWKKVSLQMSASFQNHSQSKDYIEILI